MSLPINQMGGGGGLGSKALALATAAEADVAVGKTFYAGSTQKKTGTLKKYAIKSGTVELDGGSDINVTAEGKIISAIVSCIDENASGGVSSSVPEIGVRNGDGFVAFYIAISGVILNISRNRSPGTFCFYIVHEA